MEGQHKDVIRVKFSRNQILARSARPEDPGAPQSLWLPACVCVCVCVCVCLGLERGRSTVTSDDEALIHPGGAKGGLRRERIGMISTLGPPLMEERSIGRHGGV